MPKRVAVAPATFLPTNESAQLWVSIAREANERGLVVETDPRLVLGFQQLDAGTSGMDRNGPTARALRGAAHELLHAGMGVDGVLYVEIAERTARVKDGFAVWDGARESVFANRSDPHASAGGMRSDVPAWSLRIWMEDPRGRMVREGFGGLSLSEHFHAGRWQRLPTLPRLEPEVFSAAIHSAVAELTAD